MFYGVTFNNQMVKPKDDGGLYQQIFPDGALWGCEVTFTPQAVIVAPGLIICGGRMIRNDGAETITIEDITSGYMRLKLQIDLNGIAEITDFEQVQSKYEFSTSQQFPSLVQEDINGATGRLYEMEIGVFSTSGGQIQNAVRVLQKSNPSSPYYRRIFYATSATWPDGYQDGDMLVVYA